MVLPDHPLRLLDPYFVVPRLHPLFYLLDRNSVLLLAGVVDEVEVRDNKVLLEPEGFAVRRGERDEWVLARVDDSDLMEISSDDLDLRALRFGARQRSERNDNDGIEVDSGATCGVPREAEKAMLAAGFISVAGYGRRMMNEVRVGEVAESGFGSGRVGLGSGREQHR